LKMKTKEKRRKKFWREGEKKLKTDDLGVGIDHRAVAFQL
jgi:hypothetical protein